MTKDEALRLALEALKKCQSALAEELSVWDIDPPLHHILESHNLCGPAIAACEAALEAKDKPVQNQLMALIDENQRLRAELKFNTTPPQRKPLTDEEIDAILIGLMRQHKSGAVTIARAIEVAHGIKGEA